MMVMNHKMLFCSGIFKEMLKKNGIKVMITHIIIIIIVIKKKLTK